MYKPDIGASTMTAQNAGRQTGYGFELELTRPLSRNLQLNANFAWQRSQDRLNHADAADSPERQLYVNACWQRDNWHIDIRANWVMHRNRYTYDKRPAVKVFISVDFSFRKVISKHLEMTLLAENLFNEEILEPSPYGDPTSFIESDLPLADRSLNAEIRFLF